MVADVAGVVALIGFIVWQARNTGEPLLPLALFRDRNFSLANGAISAVGFTVTSMSLPLVFYVQIVRGLTPTQSALLLAPTAVISGVLAPFVGKLIDRVNPPYVAFTGLLLLSLGLFWYAALLTSDTAVALLLLPGAVLGLAKACIWGPISTTATRNLPRQQAGAGSGVYNTTRQVGAVLGSASIAGLMQTSRRPWLSRSCSRPAPRSWVRSSCCSSPSRRRRRGVRVPMPRPPARTHPTSASPGRSPDASVRCA